MKTMFNQKALITLPRFLALDLQSHKRHTLQITFWVSLGLEDLRLKAKKRQPTP